MTYETNYISHHGVKGQKWGVRRYQNKNGSLTSEGKRRYGGKESLKKVNTSKKGNTSKKTSIINDIKEKYKNLPDGTQKAIKIGASVAGVYFGTQLVGGAIMSMTLMPFIRNTFNEAITGQEKMKKKHEEYEKEIEEINKKMEEDWVKSNVKHEEYQKQWEDSHSQFQKELEEFNKRYEENHNKYFGGN